MSENLLEGLNEAQKKAVTHMGGPLLIVAGAGTGKTTVITRRIAWLIAQGAKPQEILALTFTDKAAGEMEERVDILLPYGYVDIQISTFHSFCEQLLRDEGAAIGLSRDFKVVSEMDAWLLARQQLDKFALDYYRPLGNPTKYLRSLLTHFSRAKDQGIYPQDYVDFAEAQMAAQDSAQADADATQEVARVRELAGAYHTYQQILFEQDCLDFGDLLMLTLKLLRERSGVLERVRTRYRHMLVDEFQDTNLCQYDIVKLIAAPINQLTVVGDDDQSIYKFRGASLSNILQFQKDFPNAATVVLTENYRSVQIILDMAYAFIQRNNPNRLEAQLGEGLTKKLAAQGGRTGCVEHLHAATLEEEADAVVSKISELQAADADATWDDFAILVRSNDSAGAFVAALDREGIPYHFHALRGLYTKNVILDALAFLRVVDNPHESPSLYRVLSHPMVGLMTLAISELTHLSQRKGKSLWQACELARAFTQIPEEDLQKVGNLLATLTRLRSQAPRNRSSVFFVHTAKETGLFEWVNKQEEKTKQDNFRYLQQFYERLKKFDEAAQHPTLHEFLQEFAHERDAGEQGKLSFDVSAGPHMVRIMTVHAAKGLEFKYVFIVNLVDRRFPTSQRGDAIPLPAGLCKEQEQEGDWHLEEERRLFYVAMTRAKQGLYLTSAEDYGGTHKKKLSRFLHELKVLIQRPPVVPLIKGDTSVSPPYQGGVRGGLRGPELVVHLPKHFSFTQLAAFRTCPLQYKFAHILRVPVFGKPSFSFGKTMHNALQRFFIIWLERTGAQQGNLFATSSSSSSLSSSLPVSLDALLTIYADSWQDDWFKDDRQREEYRKRGADGLRTYYQKMLMDPPRPLALEQGFTLKIKDVILKGRMDRVDICDDGVEIIDYKTGRPKQKLDADDKEQLLLYQLACKKVLHWEPKKLTYVYLEDASRLEFLGSDEELEELEEKIVERVAAMRQNRFEATPGMWCSFCDFSDICEHSEA